MAFENCCQIIDVTYSDNFNKTEDIREKLFLDLLFQSWKAEFISLHSVGRKKHKRTYWTSKHSDDNNLDFQG